MKNYGISEGVDCRNGKAVFNKLSCQSLRVFPAPPGYWEQSICIPIRSDEIEGPEAREQRNAMYRGFMFSNPEFVSCKHPDCWICMGQAAPPTKEQIVAFSFKHPNDLNRRLPYGLLSGEKESLYGKRPTKHSLARRIISRMLERFSIPWRGRDR